MLVTIKYCEPHVPMSITFGLYKYVVFYGDCNLHLSVVNIESAVWQHSRVDTRPRPGARSRSQDVFC